MTRDDTADVTLQGLTELRPTAGTDLSTQQIGPDVVEVTATATDGRPGVHVEVELSTAVAYWHPNQRSDRTLPADWMPAATTSLVNSAPVGVLYTAAGTALFGWAAAETVAELAVGGGVSEERKTFTVDVRVTRPLPGPLVLRLDAAGGLLTEALRRLSGWVSERQSGAVLDVPALAKRPVYSTWYTFTQDVDTAVVESEAELAVKLGCGSVFIDDGWQRLAHGRGYGGCGDWVPDEEKFADLPGTIARIREQGAGVALWIAPLLVGEQSEVAASLAPYASRGIAHHHCSILDPRFAQVRDHLAEVCLRLVVEYGADALKIDFLDTAMVYEGTESGGDIADVGEAMAALLARIRERLTAAGRPDVAFEFRQPYVSPAIARHGQILRAGDCPADALVNRRSTLDCRLLSVGQVVHADPMMWGPTGGAEAVAQQVYAGWFSVPQISMRLSELDEVQSDALRGLLSLWADQADVTLDGELSVSGAERGYDKVRAVRADLARAVIAAYVPGVVDLPADGLDDVTVIHANASPRLVLRTARPISGGIVRSAAGRDIGSVAAAASGLVDLEVPAFGSVTLILA